MVIIERILWLLSNGIKLIIFAAIVLMIIRLITDAMDLNPFAWTSRTVRRLTDGFVMPVRGGLRQLGVEPKFAPLVVIILVLILGYFVYQLAETIGHTIVDVWTSGRRGAVIAAIGFLINGLLSLYLILIIARVVFSWGQISYRNRIMRFLVDTTEPLLGPLRRMLPRLGWIDISPLVAGLIIMFLRAAVNGTLLIGV